MEHIYMVIGWLMSHWLIGLYAVAVYVVLSCMFAKAADYFYGSSAEERVWYTFGILVVGAIVLLKALDRIAWRLWLLLTSPWQYRNWRLLKKECGIWYDDPLDVRRHQPSVDRVLSHLARELHNSCDYQTRMRQEGLDSDVAAADKLVASDKAKFWHLHSLARKCGFKTKPSWKKYELMALDEEGTVPMPTRPSRGGLVI